MSFASVEMDTNSPINQLVIMLLIIIEKVPMARVRQ